MALKEVFDALKTTILLNERVASLAGEVKTLASDARLMDNRLVRVETALELLSRGGFAAVPPVDGAPPPRALEPPKK